MACVSLGYWDRQNKESIGNLSDSTSVTDLDLVASIKVTSFGSYDLNGASYSGTSFDASSNNANLQEVEFNDNGTKMYLTDNTNGKVREYGLSTAFDVSTASLNSQLDTTTNAVNPLAVAFNNDGTKMFRTECEKRVKMQDFLKLEYRRRDTVDGNR